MNYQVDRGGFPFNNGGFGNGYGNRRNRSGFKQASYSDKKHTGCRSKIVNTVGNGEYVCVYGWNYSKTRGMITAVASPYKKAKAVESRSGKTWISYVVKITNKTTLQTTFHNGMFDKATNRVYIKELNMIMSPARNYFGRHISKR